MPFHHDDGGVDDEPKSIAPTEQIGRFSCAARGSHREEQCEGMVAATISALRRLPRNIHCSGKISAMPNAILCRTVLVVM